MDRPPSPIFVPQSSGDDVATQIEPGELFDFDLEVQPILEALVGAWALSQPSRPHLRRLLAALLHFNGHPPAHARAQAAR